MKTNWLKVMWVKEVGKIKSIGKIGITSILWPKLPINNLKRLL